MTSNPTSAGVTHQRTQLYNGNLACIIMLGVDRGTDCVPIITSIRWPWWDFGYSHKRWPIVPERCPVDLLVQGYVTHKGNLLICCACMCMCACMHVCVCAHGK